MLSPVCPSFFFLRKSRISVLRNNRETIRSADVNQTQKLSDFIVTCSLPTKRYYIPRNHVPQLTFLRPYIRRDSYDNMFKPPHAGDLFLDAFYVQYRERQTC